MAFTLRAPTASGMSLGRPSVARVTAARPAPLSSSFVNASVVKGMCASISGLTIKVNTPTTSAPVFGLDIEANAKRSLGCTKGGTNIKRRRNSGFRARMATPGGRAVIKSRRAKGRKALAKASDPKDGKSK